MTARTVGVDDFDRTALIYMHSDAENAVGAYRRHRESTITLVASAVTCASREGQAAIWTSAATAVRAFGTTRVYLADGDQAMSGGPAAGRRLADVVAGEGCTVITAAECDDARAMTVAVGAPAAEGPTVDLIAVWDGWVATVSPAESGGRAPMKGNVLAAIAAGALGVSEAFLRQLEEPGSDAGYRTVRLDLWDPAGVASAGRAAPPLSYAPASWWLVGLGHLGQAFAHVISWLPYEDPSGIEVVLQDTDRTVPANHSTGVLTPVGSRGVRKTRLVAAVLDEARFATCILETRVEPGFQKPVNSTHVALLGVDNLATRRLISAVGWVHAIDVGLGANLPGFDGISLRKFPGHLLSEDVEAWKGRSLPAAAPMPDTHAFAELVKKDMCGAVELAGKAVGVSFVGVVAGSLAIAEAVRGLHGGAGFSVLTVSLRDEQAECGTLDGSEPPLSAPLSSAR